jgi:hypothetical protein
MVHIRQITHLQDVFTCYMFTNYAFCKKTSFLKFASLIGLLLYSIWSRLWLSIKALVV